MQKRILVVEDDSGVSQMLALTLEAAGYKVLTATNGAEGIEIAIKDMPDLIITDVLMPVMDGFKFFKNLKSNQLTADIPVIILTARGQMRDTFKIYDADAFIEKPSRGTVLLNKVEQCLNRPAYRSGGRRVLLASTSPIVLSDMEKVLMRYGCRIQKVTSGQDIVVQAVLFKPELIIMDIQMEGTVSSAQIIRSVRLLPHCRDIPLLIFSYIDAEQVGLYEFHIKAGMIPPHLERCHRAGATNYLGAFNEKTFREKIGGYLTGPHKLDKTTKK